MYALCGEKEVRVFGRENRTFSHDDFLLLHKNYQIILDLNGLDLSLEKLNNCSLLDAHRILSCKKETLTDYESVFLVPRSRLNFGGKGTYYIQKCLLKNCKLFHQLNHEEGMFLIENIIAEFCGSITEIDEETWWLYAAEHYASSLRIIAGIGRGVVLSRFLHNISDVSDEVLKTIIYLRRFGLEKTIKVLTSLNDVAMNLDQNEICKIFKLENYDESVLIKFLSKNKTIKKIFARNSSLARYLNAEKIYPILYTVLSFLVLSFLILYKEISNEEKLISALPKNIYVATDNLNLRINADNFFFIKQFVTILKDCENPIGMFLKISEICHENKILVEQFSMENCNSIKIKTLLNKKQFEKLKKLSNEQLDICVEKFATSGEEYEELGINKKFGAIVCIKTK